MKNFLAASVLAIAGLLSGGADAAHYSSDVRIELTGPHDSGAYCSGVYLGSGIVLTARHCVAKGTTVEVIFDKDGEDGPAATAKVEWVSKEDDLAAYRIDDRADVDIAQLACRLPKIGEPIAVVGNPFGERFIHTWGRVAGAKRSTGGGLRRDDDEVPIDAEIASGNSGGPAYDASGFVIGIVNEGIEGGAHAVGHLYFMVSSEGACGKYAPATASLP